MRHVIPIDTASIPASDSTTQTATFTFAFLPKVKVNDSFRNLKKDFFVTGLIALFTKLCWLMKSFKETELEVSVTIVSF